MASFPTPAFQESDPVPALEHISEGGCHRVEVVLVPLLHRCPEILLEDGLEVGAEQKVDELAGEGHDSHTPSSIFTMSSRPFSQKWSSVYRSPMWQKKHLKK